MNVQAEWLVFLACVIGNALGLKPCPGDTRGDKRCNHDPTHRVCAKIGDAGSSFWGFTGQTSWCNTRGHYGGPYGSDLRCPPDEPTWCICKWATAKWIKGQGCDDTIEFDCDATDVCNLKNSYIDYNVELHPAHDCMAVKCRKQWEDCPEPGKRASNDIDRLARLERMNEMERLQRMEEIEEMERLRRLEKYYRNVL